MTDDQRVWLVVYDVVPDCTASYKHLAMAEDIVSWARQYGAVPKMPKAQINYRNGSTEGYVSISAGVDPFFGILLNRHVKSTEVGLNAALEQAFQAGAASVRVAESATEPKEYFVDLTDLFDGAAPRGSADEVIEQLCNLVRSDETLEMKDNMFIAKALKEVEALTNEVGEVALALSGRGENPEWGALARAVAMLIDVASRAKRSRDLSSASREAAEALVVSLLAAAPHMSECQKEDGDDV